jgi:hypothetical protein
LLSSSYFNLITIFSFFICRVLRTITRLYHCRSLNCQKRIDTRRWITFESDVKSSR